MEVILIEKEENMDKRLYLLEWNKTNTEDKKRIIEQIINEKKIPLVIIGTELFSQNDVSVETVVMKYEESEFVFIPGMENITLGWDEKTPLNEGVIRDIKEDKAEEIETMKSECDEIREDYEEQIENAKESGNKEKAEELIEEMNDELAGYEEYIHIDIDEYVEIFKKKLSSSCSDIRKVTVNPMIVERDLISVSGYDSYSEFKDKLNETDFTLPTEDEYEYICTGGKRTLFRWGDSLKEQLDSIYKIGTASDDENILYEPNMFGLHILYDSYMYELVDDECFYKGGDGGCSLCGGEGAIGVAPVFVTFSRPCISDNIGWDIEKQYCYYRRILRI